MSKNQAFPLNYGFLKHVLWDGLVPMVFSADSQFFLKNIWYHAMPSQALKPGKVISKTLLNEPILFGRTQTGQPFALRDICPHRAVPLSCGWFDGNNVQCCYHGWRFDPAGRCIEIPSLMVDQQVELQRFDVPRYEVQEIQGNLWIYMPDSSLSCPSALEVPKVPGFSEQAKPVMTYTIQFPCFIDHAVVGLMDPAHSPFVHRAWWWRGSQLNPEIKWFDPIPYGFSMRRHTMPTHMARGYWLMGGVPKNEIAFYLPGVRTEETTTAKYRVTNLTTVTPISDDQTEVTFQLYWDLPWGSLLKPLLWYLIPAFLKQDREVVIKQQRGLKHQPVLRLIKDSDMLARWYYQLKREFQQSQLENRAFVTPVKKQQLRWMA
jgi:phenylpropionate dioxygenase-like ring-hydroxylating dioxygenase large terminal subunit